MGSRAEAMAEEMAVETSVGMAVVRKKMETNRELMCPMFDCYKLVDPAQPLGGPPAMMALPAQLHLPRLSNTNCSANRVRTRLYYNYLHTTTNGVCWMDSTGALMQACYTPDAAGVEFQQLHQFDTAPDSTSEPP